MPLYRIVIPAEFVETFEADDVEQATRDAAWNYGGGEAVRCNILGVGVCRLSDDEDSWILEEVGDDV